MDFVFNKFENLDSSTLNLVFAFISNELRHWVLGSVDERFLSCGSGGFHAF